MPLTAEQEFAELVKKMRQAQRRCLRVRVTVEEIE